MSREGKNQRDKGGHSPGREVEVLEHPYPGVPETEADLRAALAEVERRHRETRALLEAAHAVMAHDQFAETAREIFDRCRNVIGAAAGYISLLNPAGTANELVFLDAGGLPCTVDPDLPMPIRGLRAVAYATGEVVYDNDFLLSDHVRFLPPGHVVLENVLFAPLKTPEHKTVGLLGLSNKPGGFTQEDACLAAGFAEIAAIALGEPKDLRGPEKKRRKIAGFVRLRAGGHFHLHSGG
ncbi:MAG: GAF domain-containing protein [Desulfobaccales bacterium]